MRCILPCFRLIFVSHYSNSLWAHIKNTIKMKKLLTATFATIMVLANMQSSNGQPLEKQSVVPFKNINGQWMPSVNLPVVDIVANKTVNASGYELPEVVISAAKNLDGLFPAVNWNGDYIASVSLRQVDVVASRKKVSLASIFSFEWLFKK